MPSPIKDIAESAMVYRPAWNGHLKLSLVTCPVALYKAVEPAKRGLSFNLINPVTGNRVRMKPVDEADAAPTAQTHSTADRGARRSSSSPPPAPPELLRSELVKGYAVDKDLYVTVTDEELRNLRLESNGAIQIERFVPEAEIDRLYWDTPYYLVPDGKLGTEAYSVVREAMREQGQVALARAVMNGRERQFALEVRGKGILAHALRTHQEVRPAEEFFDQLPDAEPDANMVAIAKQILRQHEGPFDPTAFVDRYQEAVRQLVADKQAANGVTRAGRPVANEAQVADLMAALKASLAPPPTTRPQRLRAAAASAPAPKVSQPRRPRNSSAG
jgi:DNA end-binding protein Ku